MTRAHNESAAARPTVEQEMAAFKGFSTNNGDTITAETPEDLNPVSGKNMTAEELAAVADKAGATKEKPAAGEKTPAAGAAKELTQAEQDKIITELDTKLGREATEAEVTKALADAKNAKNGSGKTPAELKSAARYRKMERERNDAVRKTSELEARLVALEAGNKAPLTADKEKGKDAAAEGAPDPKKFEYGELDANYIRALARWEAKQEIAEQTKTQQTETLTAQQKADKEKFEAARAEFEDKGAELYEDFDEVVMQGARDKAWPLSDTLGGVLMTSEYGARIAYELASDPKEAKRVFDLAPMRQVAWLGRREAVLEAESAGSGANDDGKGESGKAAADTKDTKTATAKVSKAPAPITRTRGQGSASETPGSTQDFAAFEAAAMGRKT